MPGAMLVIQALPVINGCRLYSSARKSPFSPDISANQNALLENKIEPAVTHYEQERICSSTFSV
jgi:hypothetical protein